MAGWSLKQGDLRPDADDAKADLDDVMGGPSSDPTKNYNMPNSKWGAGRGPTPLNASNKAFEEKNGYAGGGCVTARGAATMAKLRARHGKDV